MRGTEEIPINVFVDQVPRIEVLFCREPVIRGQDRHERLLDDEPVFQIRVWLAPQKGDVERTALQIIGQVDREAAVNPDLEVGQVIAENVRRRRNAVDLVPDEETYRETWASRVARCCRAEFDRGFGLGE